MSIFLAYINMNYIKNSNYNVNLLDFIFLTLSGPNIKENNIFIENEWLLTQFVFLYLFVDIGFYAFCKKGSLVLLRIGSRAKLWTILIREIILKIFLFLFIEILAVVLLGIFFFPIKFTNNILVTSELVKININNLFLVLSMLVLLMLTYINLALIQNIISIIFKSPIISIVFCSILQVFTLNSGKFNVNLIKWLPGNQSIMVRHSLINPSILNFNIRWSIFYNLLFISVFSIIGFLCTDKLDVI